MYNSLPEEIGLKSFIREDLYNYSNSICGELSGRSMGGVGFISDQFRIK
jgi:hypothetical protein